MKLNVLAFAAHPDDIELGAGGTLARLSQQGYKVGVVDMARGEFGTRGDMATRTRERDEATRILQLTVRENLELPDNFLVDDRPTRLRCIEMIRKYQPDLVLTHYPRSHHPDHEVTGRVVTHAAYLAGLGKIPSPYPRWRPRYVIYHQIPPEITPTIVVDITATWELKMAAVRAYASQFSTTADHPPTMLSAPDFLARMTARHRFYGSLIKTQYGEGFVMNDVVPIYDLVATLAPHHDPFFNT